MNAGCKDGTLSVGKYAWSLRWKRRGVTMGWRRVSWRGGKEGKLFSFIATGGEAGVEFAEVGLDVGGVGAECVDAVTISQDEAGEDSGCVCGVGGVNRYRLSNFSNKVVCNVFVWIDIVISNFF